MWRAALLVLAVCTAALAADDETAVAEALSHHSAGRFEEARALLEPAARGGSAVAFYHLGLMNARGEGGERDLAVAARHMRAAAEGEHAHAQFLLGNMYLRGDGVAADPVQAHLWLSLAASNGWWKARELREKLVAERMTPAQVAEAARLYKKRRLPQPEPE
ncbi:MAG: sel1 repeat family protein [Rhodocyclaceae bacterium]|nr:sel1 repeat family protein [Rhodocyclaceae bacterium]MCA3146721.1 sel1 repeat family protein [Rhodocyclaceae bacterium]